jgi:Fic family protein
MSYILKREQIDNLKQRIDAFGALSNDIKNKINYKFRLDWNYYSNSMEGNTLTMEETRSVMINNINVKDKPLKDIMEMQGHDKIITDILKIGQGNIRLSEARIIAIHKGIMFENNTDDINKIGTWKKDANYIINYKGERFDFVQPGDVAERMHELLNKTNAAIDAIKANRKDAPHPIDVAIRFHLDYVIIHPFYDGNGRTARILTNLLLISFGYPPFWIKENEKDRYSRYIADIQGYGGSPDLFSEFVAELILRSQQLVLNAIEGGEIEEEDDFLKEIKLIKNKTENLGLPKSPKLILEVFQAVRDQIWKKLQITLQHFDELFSDSKTEHFVNELEEAFPDKNLLQMPYIVPGGPRKIKIFGHDIYETDVKRINWYHVKYGLKGSNNNKFEINLGITLNQKDYSVKLSADYKTLAEEEKKYGDILLSDIAMTMDKVLKEYLLAEIKKRIE